LFVASLASRQLGHRTQPSGGNFERGGLEKQQSSPPRSSYSRENTELVYNTELVTTSND